jgi:hypothetical protein
VDLKTEVISDFSIEEEGDAFHEDSMWLGSGEHVNFSSCVSVDSLPYAAIPLLASCVMTVAVAGTVKERKMETNVNLNQCQALPECTPFMKLLNNVFTHTVLVNVMNRTFRTCSWRCFV